MRCALLGDNIAEMAHKNGWSVSHLFISSTCSLSDSHLGESKRPAAVPGTLAAGCRGLVALGNSTGNFDAAEGRSDNPCLVQGIVINGCIRDSEDISKMPLGVKALNTYPLKSSKRDKGLRDVPVTFASTTFQPGSWLYADRDGILVAAEQLKL